MCRRGFWPGCVPVGATPRRERRVSLDLWLLLYLIQWLYPQLNWELFLWTIFHP